MDVGALPPMRPSCSGRRYAVLLLPSRRRCTRLIVAHTMSGRNTSNAYCRLCVEATPCRRRYAVDSTNRSNSGFICGFRRLKTEHARGAYNAGDTDFCTDACLHLPRRVHVDKEMEMGGSDSGSEPEYDRYGETYGATRLERGFRIAADRFQLLRTGQIRAADAGPEHNAVQARTRSGRVWAVRSQHRVSRGYRVRKDAHGVWSCTCPDFQQNGVNNCKHCISVRLSAPCTPGSPGRPPAASPLDIHAATLPPTSSRAWFPYGSAVYDPATGGFGEVSSDPTVTAAVSWDALTAFPSAECLVDILPAEAGRALDQPTPPTQAWFDQWA
jgi:hypothetical protein